MLFFDKYGGENRGAFSKENLKQFAADLELDTDAFNSCLDSGRYTSLVESETATIQALGVRGTPAFVVNGQPIVGAQSFDVFQQVIETELAQDDGASPTIAPATPESASTPAASTTSTQPGVAVPVQGAEHVEPDEDHPPYNSDPPTSGWHLAEAIPAGFYEEPQTDEALVHNLEHGHIVIAYDCDKLAGSSRSSAQTCEAVKAKLRALVDRYDGWKVTVVPRQNKDAPLAVTAWGRIDKLDGYDEGRITAFIDAYRDKGPENTPE